MTDKLGLIPNMPFSEYAADGGLNHSSLKLIDQSPMDFMLYKTRDEDTDSADKAFGRAYHHFVLEPATFASNFMVTKKIVRRGGEWEKIKSQAEIENKQIIWEEEYEIIKSMRKVLGAHPLVPGLFDGSDRELSCFWQELGASGKSHRCKSRIDIFNRGLGIVADLKTTTSSHVKDFPKAIFDYNYDAQAAWYIRGLDKLGVPEIKNFLLIAQMKEEPYHVMLYSLTIDTILYGHQECDERFQKYDACMFSGQWPGYSEEPFVVRTPEWKVKRLMGNRL